MYHPGSGAGSSNASSFLPDTRATLLCFSHLRWNFVYQRPQHLLSRAARTYQVVFLEEPLWEDVKEARLDLFSEPGGVRRAVPVLPWGTDEALAVGVQRGFVDELIAGRPGAPLLLWYYTPMALPFSRHLDAELTVYDCMDELSAFRGAPSRLTELEEELFARADLVFTGGQSLFEAKRGRHRSVHLFPSSIEAAHFHQARGGVPSEPADQNDLPHPRLGYFGVIDERMDLRLLADLADMRPDWSFVMIGPVVKVDEAELPRRPNIHWLGGKSYGELPGYLAGWDVGLMPFALNESTRFISPTKTPEYLAAGIPVVSTAIVDVVRSYGEAGLVRIAADAETAVAAAEAALSAPKGPWLEKVDRRLAQSSWDMTWDSMDELIRSKQLRAAPSRSAPAAAVESAHV